MAETSRSEARIRRHERVRKHLSGTSAKPRLSVFRSLSGIYAQVIDDSCGCTLVAASSQEKALAEAVDGQKKVDRAVMVGKLVAERAKAKGISKVVFDRNGFLYHGRVKAVSAGAREAGLQF